MKEFMQAIYRPPDNQNDVGNPFVEALPPKVPDKVLVSRLRRKIAFDEDERQFDADTRLEMVDRLESWIIPQPEYFPTLRMVEKSILDSYRARNPLSPTTNHYLHYLNPDDTIEAPETGRPKSLAKAATVVGVTGVGKSRMLDRILDCYPQVLEHDEFEGTELHLLQVIWIKVTCLDGMSLKGLCHSILQEIDNAVGREHTKPAGTIDALLTQIERQLRLHFVGLLAIDELQELEAGGKAGANRITAFLLNLIDRAGVPILFCGNPNMLTVLQRKFRIARRAEQGGYIEIDAMSPDNWEVFTKRMWRHQWTNTPTELTKEIIDYLYELTAGIADFAIKTYKAAQKLVIGTGDERITLALLKEARDSSCALTRQGLEWLRKSDLVGEQTQYDDLVLHWGEHFNDRVPETGRFRKKASTPRESTKVVSSTSIGDLTRPHHTEFIEKLADLRDDPMLRDRLSQVDLMRSLSRGLLDKETINNEILLEDPLQGLAKLAN